MKGFVWSVLRSPRFRVASSGSGESCSWCSFVFTAGRGVSALSAETPAGRWDLVRTDLGLGVFDFDGKFGGRTFAAQSSRYSGGMLTAAPHLEVRRDMRVSFLHPRGYSRDTCLGGLCHPGLRGTD